MLIFLPGIDIHKNPKKKPISLKTPNSQNKQLQQWRNKGFYSGIKVDSCHPLGQITFLKQPSDREKRNYQREYRKTWQPPPIPEGKTISGLVGTQGSSSGSSEQVASMGDTRGNIPPHDGAREVRETLSGIQTSQQRVADVL